jgi:hypothetical protein
MANKIRVFGDRIQVRDRFPSILLVKLLQVVGAIIGLLSTIGLSAVMGWL